MDEIVAFVERYAQAEYEEQIASYTEKKYSVYMDKQKAVKAFMEPTVTSGFSRTAFESDAYFGQFAPKAERLAPRTLFQIKKFAHPKYVDVWQAYVSGDHRGDADYDRSIYVAKVGDELKIVAIYVLDPEAEDEGELLWIRYRGSKLQHLGEPLEVKKIKPPTFELHREEYDAQ